MEAEAKRHTIVYRNSARTAIQVLVWFDMRFQKGQRGYWADKKMSEETKKKMSEAHKGMVPWNKGRKCPSISVTLKGRKLSDETRLKMSKNRKGRKLSQETKEKISTTRVIRRIKPSVETCQKISQKLKGNKPWSTGKRFSEEFRKKLSEAHKGKISGMKGKKHSEESLEKMKASQKNRVPWIPWNKGKKGCYSEETRLKISQARKNQPDPRKNKKHSEETKKKLSEMRIGKYCGENHPQWKGGISFEPYCPKFNDVLKEQIRVRDNRTCQLCGLKENGRKLDIHHVHYDKPNCEPDLITLCRGCNSKVNFDREHYENLFMEKLKARQEVNV